MDEFAAASETGGTANRKMKMVATGPEAADDSDDDDDDAEFPVIAATSHNVQANSQPFP